MSTNEQKEAILILLGEFYKMTDHLVEPGREALKAMKISYHWNWKIRPHGIGICASNVVTGEVVDFDFVYHWGVLVFDAYKFAAYLESKYPQTNMLITVFSHDLTERQQEYFDVLKSLADKELIGKYSGIVSGYYLRLNNNNKKTATT